MRNVIGIVNLHDCPHLGPITLHRPTGAVSFLGRYALMDFTLSNFTNSGIDKVAVLAEYSAHSVRNHLKNGEVWIKNTKLGFQRILTNEDLLQVSKFNTDVNNIIANKNVFIEQDPDYIVVAPVFMLMSYDYHQLLEAHVASGADVTILCKHLKNNTDKDFFNCDIVDLDSDGNIAHFVTNTCRRKEADVSLESFIFTRESFAKIIAAGKDISLLYSLRKLVAHFVENKLIVAKPCFFDGCVIPILSFEHYVRHSFDLLKYEKRMELFKEDWPIYTTTHNTPPALYGDRAIVCNSFIANGCIVKGKVKNSIISRDVIIEEGASVEDSIIFTQAEIGPGVKVKNVMADKHSKLIELKRVGSEKEEILYIGRGERV